MWLLSEWQQYLQCDKFVFTLMHTTSQPVRFFFFFWSCYVEPAEISVHLCLLQAALVELFCRFWNWFGVIDSAMWKMFLSYFQLVFKFALFETTGRLNRERFPEDAGESSPGRGCHGFSWSVLEGGQDSFQAAFIGVLWQWGSHEVLPAVPGFGGECSGGHRFIHSFSHILPSIPVVPRHNILTPLVPLPLCVLNLHASLPLALCLPFNSFLFSIPPPSQAMLLICKFFPIYFPDFISHVLSLGSAIE